MTSHEPYSKRKKTFLWILKTLIGGLKIRGVGLRDFGVNTGNVRIWMKIGKQTESTMRNPKDLVKKKLEC